MSSTSSEPTPRQVLYALVSAGFVAMVVVFVIGAAIAGLVPLWWTLLMAGSLLGATIWIGLNWRRTGPVLLLAIGQFVVWTIGTLLVR